MNLKDASNPLRRLAFRAARRAAWLVPGGRISIFGRGDDRIGSILIINLDRQPKRWKKLLKELRRFRTAAGEPLTTIVRRLPAIDARDGRAVAATADVDTIYTMGDQLFVQPDPQLEKCFGTQQLIRMTRQEVAVARSHVEAWKVIAAGPHSHVLVLEDDVWFRPGAAKAIERGWRAALGRRKNNTEPHLLYLSFKDAGGMAVRAEECDAVFRPIRGLWYLSGYVLSREGAALLLKAMPVVGPVDLWMNYRLAELSALALKHPAILQREDGGSDNAYSVLPFLARAGIVDAGAPPSRPEHRQNGLTIAWSAGDQSDALAMALSLLGLRVRKFDGTEREMTIDDLAAIEGIFDAIVNPPLCEQAGRTAIARPDVKFIVGTEISARKGPAEEQLPPSRTAYLDAENTRWEPICQLLNLVEPAEAFPIGRAESVALFRDGRKNAVEPQVKCPRTQVMAMDDSPWVLPAEAGWFPKPLSGSASAVPCMTAANEPMICSPDLVTLVETFPGNLSTFDKRGLVEEGGDIRLVLSSASDDIRPYRSGAFASALSFSYGRFQAEIRVARGAGLVTGFFLHRDSPRQEIDIEFTGDDPCRMLVNVFFNPGDEGSAMSFGYRGSPCRIDLGFDASLDFHTYTIDWWPDRIAWSVDGIIIHERANWDPTPVPHLPMKLHGNLWAPRSEELAGLVEKAALPASSSFRKVSIMAEAVAGPRRLDRRAS